MNIACMRLAGERFAEDRQDAVSIAMQQMMRGLVEGRPESFNQIATWGDCLGMFRSIVRARATEILRRHHHSPVDAVEELPDAPQDFVPEQRFRLEELMAEVGRLRPNPPVPEVFRDRFIDGKSTDEIARQRSINRNTLCTYFANGLRTLRERLGHQEGDLS